MRSRLGAATMAIFTLFAGGLRAAPSAAADAHTTHAEVSAPSAVTVSDAPPLRRETDARTELRRLETWYQGRIGAFAYDTGTGRAISYRAHERFASNSTFKAILCGAILSKARTTDPGLMDRTLRWTEQEVVSHSPVTGLEENIKNGMTAAQLCNATITTSDNTAANVLLKQIGGPQGMTRYYRSLGDPVGRLDRWEPELNNWTPGEKRDTIQPAFMAANLRKLTLGTALAPQDRRQLIAWMRANTTGDERIRAGLPDDWTIGDKTGGGATPYAPASDIAIVWPPSSAPLIIAIYTNRNKAEAEIDNRVIASAASVLARGLGKMS